jgi:hypothetical protein
MTKKIFEFKPTEKHLLGDVEAMFSWLKAESKITPVDVKD